MGKNNEMTLWAFAEHMKAYLKKLLNTPLKADTDSFLKSHGIDGPKALELVTKKIDPADENSAIVIKKTSIKDNGSDEDGNRLKDSFTVKYRIPRKDYTKKMRNLYISLFENHIIKGSPIEESEDYSRQLSSTPYPFKDKSFGKVQSQCPPGTTGDRFAKYVNDNENNYEPQLTEDGEGGGATAADASGQYTTPLFGKPIKRKTMYITQEQADFIGEIIKEEEGNCPVQSRIGGFGYDAPMGDGKSNKKNDFYKEANDHENIMAKSWRGNMEENSIHIKEKNKGKFNATKERTGKSTEELTHSKNPLTRKRAIFAQNVKNWNKK